jgi:hypothetical protein
LLWLFAANLKWHNPKHEKVDLSAHYLVALWRGAFSASDEANIDQAINSLNSRVTVHPDKKLVLTAVSQQTRVPEKTLRSQMNATHLGYGELLVANSLVEGSSKNLNEVLAMKKGKSWATLSIELRIDPNSIVNRLRNAEKTVRTAQENARRSEAPEE